MKKKFLLCVLIFIFATILGVTQEAIIIDPITRIATWNIRYLSDNSRDDEELAMIASLFDYFDFVALQEVRDVHVLERLKDILPGWDFVASDPVGRGRKELYAFFFKDGLFEVVGEPYLIPDPEDDFIREPYVSSFKSGAFDFTVITIHTIYGNSIGKRRAENTLLDDIIESVIASDPSEQDVLLMGDFNLPADDDAWDIETHHPMVSPEIKTTIHDSSSYDNIWFSDIHTSEFSYQYSLIKFDEYYFKNDDEAASLAVSDHRPVVAYFSFPIDAALDDD